jgi:hypothetical protein
LETLNIKIIHEEAENPDMVLIQTLLEIVEADGYYAVKRIKEAMVAKYEDEAKWITEKWIGSALRRLGFNVKTRKRTYEYFLTVDKVRDLAERYNVTIELNELSEHSERGKGGSVERDSYSEPEPLVIDLSNDWSVWINAVYESFRKRYNQSFNNVEFFEFFVNKFGLPKEEASRFLKQLANDNLIFSTYQGVWVWT